MTASTHPLVGKYFIGPHQPDHRVTHGYIRQALDEHGMYFYVDVYADDPTTGALTVQTVMDIGLFVGAALYDDHALMQASWHGHCVAVQKAIRAAQRQRQALVKRLQALPESAAQALLALSSHADEDELGASGM